MPRRHPRLATALPTRAGAVAIAAGLTAAAGPLALPEQPRRRRYSAWAAAALLHALALALLFLTLRQRNPPDLQAPAEVAVVFDNGGEKQATVPKAPHAGPTEQAETPPPRPLPLPPQPAPQPTPPPPQQMAQAQPDVRLDMPQYMLPAPTLPPAPTLQAPPPARPAPRPHPRPRPSHNYLVMNDMSFGGAGSTSNQARPSAHPGLNLNVPQASQQSADDDLNVKGDAGADWNAALRKWVDEHSYYPSAASEQGQQGYVRIRFTTDRAGNVTGLRLLGSSGSPFLDQAWLGLFENAQLPPFPPDAKDDHVTVDATMHYELEFSGG